jgi:transmembrane sensor
MNKDDLRDIITRYARGESSAEEERLLMQWYNNQPVEEVPWPGQDREERSGVYDRMHQRLMRSISPARRGRVITMPFMRAAAMLLIFAGIISIILLMNPMAAEYITVKNPEQKVMFMQLPDSSRIWLNASGELKYAKDFIRNRRVQLNGEAYFEVKPDKEHPFVVDAGKLQTTVLGTSFNINAYLSDSMYSVAVISGLVQVKDDTKALARLTPSMKLEFNTVSNKAIVSSIHESSVLAWTKGKLQFEGETFRDIVRRLEKWYGYKIIYTEPAMATCRYYMTFSSALSPEELFQAMSEVTATTYKIDHDKHLITLSGGACR